MNTGNVFISYSSEEYNEASTIRSILTANGISCWMAPESIPFGSNYAREIPKAIAECKVFLLILSKKSQKSRWVALELDRAMNESKLIYPLQIEDCAIVDPFNFMLSQTQRYNAYTEKMNAMKRLVLSLRQILGLPLEDTMLIEEKPAAGVEAKAPKASGIADGTPEVRAEELMRFPVPEGKIDTARNSRAHAKPEKPAQESGEKSEKPFERTARLSDDNPFVSMFDDEVTQPSTEKEKKAESPKTAPKAESPQPVTPKAESSKPVTPKAESPKPVTPKAESPKPATPKAESPKPAAPKAESSKPATPKAKSPKPATPKAESSQPAAPKADSPKPATPKAESPKPVTPKAESPKPAAPKAESSKPVTPKAESSKPVAPKAESPKPVAPITMHQDGFEIENGLLMRYTGQDKKVVIPEGVISIEMHAFKNAPIEQVICPASLRHIGDESFRNCSSLVSAELNEGLEYIRIGAFCECKNLKEINFPRTLEEIYFYSFRGTGFTEIVIPESVKYIGRHAFSCCFELKSVDLACEEIGSGAFAVDPEIREILLRKTVKRVGEKAFSGSSLASVNIMNKDIEIGKKAFHKKAVITYTD